MSKVSTAFDYVSKTAGIFVPIIILFLGNRFTSQQRQADLAQRNSDRVALLLGHLSSENPKERGLAVKVLEHLADRKQVPDELVPALIEIVKGDEELSVAGAASVVLDKVVQAGGEASKEARESLASLTPRIYIHIRDAQQRELAGLLADRLKDKGFGVPREEIVVNKGPSSTELRFFRKDDERQANEILGLLEETGLQIKPNDLSGEYEKSTSIRPRHYEIWLGPNSTISR